MQKKIENLDEKIQIIKANLFSSKVSTILGLSTVSVLLYFWGIPHLVNANILTSSLVNPVICILSLSSGALIDKIIRKKFKVKKKIREIR